MLILVNLSVFSTFSFWRIFTFLYTLLWSIFVKNGPKWVKILKVEMLQAALERRMEHLTSQAAARQLEEEEDDFSPASMEGGQGFRGKGRGRGQSKYFRGKKGGGGGWRGGAKGRGSKRRAGKQGGGEPKRRSLETPRGGGRGRGGGGSSGSMGMPSRFGAGAAGSGAWL